MIEKVIEVCRTEVETAAKRVELAEKALSDAKGARVSGASVAALFSRYSQTRSVAFAEYLDRMLQQAGERPEAGVPDVLLDRGGADSDALHFLFESIIGDAITAHCKKLFPSGGITVEEKARRVRLAEQELGNASAAHSDAISALRRLQQAQPGSIGAGAANGA